MKFSKLALAIPAAASVLCISNVQAADDLSYGYVELDYINLDIDQPNENGFFRDDFDNGGGYGLKVSLPVSESFFLFGEYSDTETDFTYMDNGGIINPGDTDILKLNVGAGYAMELSSTSDLVFTGGYTDIDYGDFDLGGEPGGGISDLDDDSSDGFTIDGAFRTQLTPVLEGSIGARYTDIEDLDSVSLIANLMYEFNQNWGLNFSVDAGDDITTWGAGVRYSF